MATSSARPDDLDGFVRGNRAADDDLRGDAARLRAAYAEFQSGNRWGQLDAASLISAFGQYLDLNEVDARWVAQIADAFRAAGGDGGLARLPDAAIAASLRAAGLGGGRGAVTFDDPIAYGFPATSGFADDPVNTASGNFLVAVTDVRLWRRVYNSRSVVVGAFGAGWSSWADCRLRATEAGAAYVGPDGQRAVFPRQGAGYGRVAGVAAEVVPVDDGSLSSDGGLSPSGGVSSDGSLSPDRSLSPDGGLGLGGGLELRWFDGRVWGFDAAGRLIRADTVTFGYTEGRLSSVTGRGGRSVEVRWAGERIVAVGEVLFAYADGVLISAGDQRYELDEHARITAVADADGVAEARNSYDADGRVVEQVSRFGLRTRYAYLPGRVTVVGDLEGGVTNTYVHDQHGRLLSVTDGHGESLSRTYDEWGNPVTVTDRKGAVSTARWDDHGRLLRRTMPGEAAFDYRYDDAGRLLEVVTGDAVVRYRYVGEERIPAAIEDPEGGVTRFEVRAGLVHRVIDPDGVSLTFGFDPAGELISTTDGLGNTARLRRDAEGRLVATVTPLGRETLFRYDARGRLVEREDPAGGVWRYAHSPAGRIVAVTDPAGARRETRYGPHGSIEATVDPLGQVTGRAYDDVGNLSRLTAPDGAKWDFTYDALSRLTATTDPAGATWLREYDAEGNPIGAVDPSGVHRTADVDGNGRITGLGDGLTGSAFEYDDLGRTTAHVRPDGTEARAGYDRCGRRTTITAPLGGVTRIEYTAAGRVRRVLSPGGRATVFDYDAAGRRVARTDGAGRRTEFRYDADGALLTAGPVTFGYDDAGRLARRDGTRFTYDAVGRVVAVTDPTGGTRRFEHDAAGRLVAAIDQLGNRTVYDRHPRGWVTRVTDPLGAVTAYRHDERGRVVRMTDPLGRHTTFTWDNSGRLTGRTDGAGRTVAWRYDAFGRVVTMTAGDGTAVTFRRDTLGRPVAVDEGEHRQRLVWDRAGRLIENDRDGLVLRRRYGADGERTALVQPDGSATTYTYDDGGLLSGLSNGLTGPLAVTRDALGRVVAVTAADGRQATWEYAGPDLAGYASGGRTTRLTRDAAGRIVSDGVRDYRYDAAGQLIGAGGRVLAYDAAGRLVRDGDRRFDYDAAGQLTGSGYEYDGSGRRVREPSGRAYEWDGFGRLTGVDAGGRRMPVRVDSTGELAEVDGQAVLWDGAPCRLGDTPIAGPGIPWVAGAEPLDPDWQGAPGGDRDEWGAPALTEPGIGYRGELEFAGLTWLRNRVYDPSSRAFLSPDPLAAVPGTAWSGNPYHYAGNDPLGHADPLGLRPITDTELAAYRDSLGSGFFEDAADWVGENGEYLAAGAMVVGGVALMFTGVGGPAGIALMAASGGLIAGGASAGIQKFTTGDVNWGQVGRDALLGAAAGGVGAGTVAALGSSARLAATNPFVREMVVNGAESVVTGGLDRGLTGGDIFSPKALTQDLLAGGVIRAPGARVGASPPVDDGLVDVWRFHTAADPESLRSILSREPPEVQERVLKTFATDPEAFREMIENHANGIKANSPFLSVTTDPAAAARTTDPDLRGIIVGDAYGSQRRAPDLSHFQVPRDRLYQPNFELSHLEGELLYYGDDLADLKLSTRPNPYGTPPSGGP
ncbi:DUF6531 domain-containing protein [Actinoplanes sp. DH11]|uniref:DUF6531 domain-containing protein n=1 Tax=Actinoplanes sp. DH11 TaxID=2857011 RepID=UPI001E31A9F2|nr:DUF6531 domain-containing protein [Actinoplanes sp. DH11]